MGKHAKRYSRNRGADDEFNDLRSGVCRCAARAGTRGAQTGFRRADRCAAPVRAIGAAENRRGGHRPRRRLEPGLPARQRDPRAAVPGPDAHHPRRRHDGAVHRGRAGDQAGGRARACTTWCSIRISHATARCTSLTSRRRRASAGRSFPLHQLYEDVWTRYRWRERRADEDRHGERGAREAQRGRQAPRGRARSSASGAERRIVLARDGTICGHRRGPVLASTNPSSTAWSTTSPPSRTSAATSRAA